MSALDKLIDKWITELCPNKREDFEERAGIIQFEANQSRDEAERAAMTEVRRKVDSDKVTK